MIDSESLLGRYLKYCLRIQPQILLNLFFYALNIGRWKIDFINDRDNFQIMLQRQVQIGKRLSFHALTGIDQ